MQSSSQAPIPRVKSRYSRSTLIQTGGREAFGKANRTILDLVASMMDECLVRRWRVKDSFPKEITCLKHFDGSFSPPKITAFML